MSPALSDDVYLHSHLPFKSTGLFNLYMQHLGRHLSIKYTQWLIALEENTDIHYFIAEMCRLLHNVNVLQNVKQYMLNFQLALAKSIFLNTYSRVKHVNQSHVYQPQRLYLDL